MAGLTGRMSTVVKAKVSKLLGPGRRPRRDAGLQLPEAGRTAAERQEGHRRRGHRQEAPADAGGARCSRAWSSSTRRPARRVSGGQEDLARTALERKNVAQTELQWLDTQVTELEDQQQKLTDSEQKLRAKIEAFRTKKEVIKAQYSAAEAQVRISEAATGVGEQMADVGLAMQRAVDKTENMKARADAVSELEAAGTFDDITALGSGEDDIDRQLKQLSSQPAVDDELAKMKGELGAGDARARRADPGAERGARRRQRLRRAAEPRRPRAVRHDRAHLRRGPVRAAGRGARAAARAGRRRVRPRWKRATARGSTAATRSCSS